MGKIKKKLKKIKDKLYYYFAEKNWGVRREYGPYVDAHQEEHVKQRWKHWWLLIRLNWHYRIRRSTQYLIPELEVKPNYPYNGGPESSKGKRPDAYHFAKSLLQYDVISFDIFDTLILRKLNTPTDVFMVVGGKLGMIDFYDVRKKSEAEARRIMQETSGTTEVTINEIYERVAYYTGIDPAEGAALEFAVERDMCIANPYMHRVYEILKAMGKTVVATSDMYLPKEKMKILLDGCGYDELDEIYVSCDYQCSKGDGGLYRILRSAYGEDAKIVHIGDYFRNDVQIAQECGLTAHHYRSCRDLGNPHRCTGMSPLIESAYRGIVNNTLHNGIKQYSRAWEYGFTYGGLVAFGYANWIHENALRSGITKLLFLARDGFVLKKVYDLLYDDIPSEYIYWSRSAAIRSISLGERFYFLDHLTTRRKNIGETVEDALKMYALQDFAPVLIRNGIDLAQEITDDNVQTLQDIMVSNWDEVEKCLTKSRKATENYIRQAIQGHQKIGIIDVGFSGRNVKILKDIIEKCGIERNNIAIYLFGNVLWRENAAMMLSGEISCYIFDARINSGIRKTFVISHTFASILFERMFSAPHPPFLGFDRHGNMEFAPAESENNKKLREIQSGIVDFCLAYRDSFVNHPEFYSISCLDAYRPIELLFANRDYVQDAVGDLVQMIRVSLKDLQSLNASS